MLRDARIESQALDPKEQEKLLREYNRQRDEQLKDKKLGSTKKNESSNHDNVPSSNFPQRPSSQEMTIAGRGKGYIYDEIAPILHSSSAGDLLQQQSQSNNSAGSQLQEETMIREANIETRSKAYQNMPVTNNMQPPDRAYAPPQDYLEHLFVMGSRVQFSDPPRYGVVRWMGNLPHVNGLIVGVELVSI